MLCKTKVSVVDVIQWQWASQPSFQHTSCAAELLCSYGSSCKLPLPIWIQQPEVSMVVVKSNFLRLLVLASTAVEMMEFAEAFLDLVPSFTGDKRQGEHTWRQCQCLVSRCRWEDPRSPVLRPHLFPGQSTRVLLCIVQEVLEAQPTACSSSPFSDFRRNKF